MPALVAGPRRGGAHHEPHNVSIVADPEVQLVTAEDGKVSGAGRRAWVESLLFSALYVCSMCKVSLFVSAVYAKCPFY